jgi:enolase 1/2/3
MTKIQSVKGREIIDSRGNPTIEVKCQLESGLSAVASVPSGASKGAHEALELRDGDEKKFGGMGVEKAVNNVNKEINQHLQNKDFDQKSLDKALIELDGTANKSRLGANAILGVSMAFARACAKENNLELFEYLRNLAGNQSLFLPEPMFNVINGGKHADSGLDIQEYMLAPIGIYSFREKVRAGSEIIASLKKIIKAKGYAVSVGDEGGFAPKLSRNEEALELIEQAIKNAGYSFDQVKIGIDAASTSFYQNGVYTLKIDGENKSLDNKALIGWYKDLVEAHPIIFIEDGLAEDDWDGFKELTAVLGDKIRIVGDDLTVTNTKRIKEAIEKKAINAVLIKLNQIGTLSETIEAIVMTKENGYVTFVSHRSGETTDTFIADLAVGLACDYIKAGSLTRGERVCKYNRLMEIEDEVNNKP